MAEMHEFFKLVLDAITEHIAVIDREGNIVFVNRAWKIFSHDNNGLINNDWKGVNYLKICNNSAVTGDESGLKAAAGIKKVINSEQSSFYFEYPCHSSDEKRWFIMQVTPFVFNATSYFVVSHKNITERKLAEEEVLYLSRTDWLTNIPNRRCLDEFLKNEHRRCKRFNLPISLAIIDIDHFKLLNDTYGHQAGDECLIQIGAVLIAYTKRPSDICGRYGGEEFLIVLGNTTIEQSLDVVNKLLKAIRELKIPNKNSPTMATVSASIGLVSTNLVRDINEKELIKFADALLYSAKEMGRNQIVYKYVK
ncbi:MAG: sensor domain-containing diguanylate cyclase [Nitrosomonas sp.]|uniref:sensor domain-containing diguanylate cyclase n=1 Tax=Nitrosomonas sp. TaxID=42353 RepID=UPI0025F11A4B|nr:sensor domain-containing diguanylate cyclase [Nitrosomonas sp.]MBY0474535.1 sensor domain-containing diguanylate cyclase [Nitrosomonas sp.]